MCNRSRRLGLACALTVLFTGMTVRSLAWHGAGHMATALIAYYDLGPKRAKAVVTILRKHPSYDKWMEQKPSGIAEGPYLFMKASTWPDDIRPTKNTEHKFHRPTWHYVNKLFVIDPAQAPDPDNKEHIYEAILKNQADLKSSDPTVQARAVCWIIHLVGDVQQPLHASALVSTTFPQGDHGGNSFFVTAASGSTNLHSYWDGLWDSTTAGPKRKPDILKVKTLAMRVKHENSRASLPDLKVNTTFPSWIDESYKLAEVNCYRIQDVKDGKFDGGTTDDDATDLPAGYEASALALGEKRLAIGGYRLADKLKDLLSLK